MATARQSTPNQSVTKNMLKIKGLGGAFALGQGYNWAAADASRNCLFITLPFALRGSGSAVSAIVSGTL
jgi:hypothetical protein